jgi:hypothetical protein
VPRPIPIAYPLIDLLTKNQWSAGIQCSGPTLLIIRESARGGIFAAFTSTPVWKENKDFYGNCIHLSSFVDRGVVSSSATNYMYCNSNSRSRGYDGLARGIGFGGTVEKLRLFLAETLEAGVYGIEC